MVCGTSSCYHTTTYKKLCHVCAQWDRDIYTKFNLSNNLMMTQSHIMNIHRSICVVMDHHILICTNALVVDSHDHGDSADMPVLKVTSSFKVITLQICRATIQA